MEACEAALGVSSSPTSAAATSGDPAARSNTSTDQPAESSSASRSWSSLASFSSNFSALLDKLNLEPVGGVRASGGYMVIENVREDPIRIHFALLTSAFALLMRDVIVIALRPVKSSALSLSFSPAFLAFSAP